MIEGKVLLGVNNLIVQFGGLKAINDVSINVLEGEFIGLIGPNGAGKTTFFNSITGNIEATSGEILFDNHKLNGKRSDQISRLGISRTFQNIRLFNKMTAIENISIGLHSTPKYSTIEAVLRMPKVKNIEKETKERAQYFLNILDLKEYENHQASSLPYGLQRRLEIARALATSPKLLLLDEPAAGMNNDECNELVDLLKRLHSELNLTIIIIEHHIDVVMRLCEKVYVLNLGSLLAKGNPQQIQTNPDVIKAYLGERRKTSEQ
mgnify:FL=1